ncbi:MAG: hypothetical protein AAF497_00775 [Planctomycetota bacterium]
MKALYSFLAISAVLAASAFGQILPITTFSYTQTDNVTGSGTIVAPAASDFGGVTITWTDTAMPLAGVRDPAGGGSAGGFVGTWDTENGAQGINGLDVALHWNNGMPESTGTPDPVVVEILGSGSDGNDYKMPVPLVFWGDPSNNDTSGPGNSVAPRDPRVPDEHVPGWGVNDYQWDLEYGSVSGQLAFPRTAMWFSPSWGLPLGGREQRYTQNENDVATTQINNDTTTGAEKDAMDGDGLNANNDGNRVECDVLPDVDDPADGFGDCTAAIGQPLEFGFGWRDRDFLADGDSIFVDNFMVRGYLGYDEAGIEMVGGGGGADGDFNDDGAYDCADIDGLINDIATSTGDTAFDLTGDGAVDLADRDAWLAEAGEANLGPGKTYLLGDATLDGVVDVSDFGIWNGNKLTNTGTWCEADFNADGVTDVSDFGIWNGNKFTSSDAAAVPEPAGLAVLLALGFSLTVLRRR